MHETRDVDLILGKTGSGKTTLARSILASRRRVIIADADFREYPAKDFGNFDDLVDYLERQKNSFFRVAYTPYEHEYPLMFDLARIIGDCTLVLEEADRFPDPRYCMEYQEIITRGRHHRVSVMALGLYPALLPSMLRRQATRIVSFRQHEPSDIDWLSAVMGEPAYQLPDLGDHEFLDWKPGIAELKPQKISLTGSKVKATIPESSENMPDSPSPTPTGTPTE